MHVISKRTLREYWENHPETEGPLKAWHDEARRAEWTMPTDINSLSNAKAIDNDRVVFFIKGGAYRLVVAVNYASRVVYIRFVGTHREYDKIDAATI